MLIVNGAGSSLGRALVSAQAGKERVIAISRDTDLSSFGVVNVNAQSAAMLERALRDLDFDEFGGEGLTWVNCQAIRLNSLLLNCSSSMIDESFRVNFQSNFVAVKSLLPKMISLRYGRFIFIGSSIAEKGDIGCFPYSVSKLTNQALQRSITLECSRFGVTANTISIGVVESPLWFELSEKSRKAIEEKIPGKKMVSLGEFCDLVAFIRGAASLNGQTVRLDGGYSA